MLPENWSYDVDTEVAVKAYGARLLRFKEGIEIHCEVTDTVEACYGLGDHLWPDYLCNMIVVDMTKPDSLESAKYHLDRVGEATCILVGTKTGISSLASTGSMKWL